MSNDEVLHDDPAHLHDSLVHRHDHEGEPPAEDGEGKHSHPHGGVGHHGVIHEHAHRHLHPEPSGKAFIDWYRKVAQAEPPGLLVHSEALAALQNAGMRPTTADKLLNVARNHPDEAQDVTLASGTRLWVRYVPQERGPGRWTVQRQDPVPEPEAPILTWHQARDRLVTAGLSAGGAAAVLGQAARQSAPYYCLSVPVKVTAVPVDGFRVEAVSDGDRGWLSQAQAEDLTESVRLLRAFREAYPEFDAWYRSVVRDQREVGKVPVTQLSRRALEWREERLARELRWLKSHDVAAMEQELAETRFLLYGTTGEDGQEASGHD